MPRRSKGAHLWLRPARRKNGRILAKSVWIIIDGKQHIATGCLEHQAGEAEKRLANYIADKYRPVRHVRELEAIDVADVLSIYLDDCGARMADQPKLERAIARLNNFWGGKTLSEITSAQCRAYVKSREKAGGARSDLETLRAAINHHGKENLHHGLVRVALPPREPRETGGSRVRKPLVYCGPVGATGRRKRHIAVVLKDRRSRPRSGRSVIWLALS
jgi:hypothetical protein